MRLFLVKGAAAHTNSVACEAGAARSEGTPQARVFASCSVGRKGGRARPYCRRGRTVNGPGRGRGCPPSFPYLVKAPQEAPACALPTRTSSLTHTEV